jgi:hypothetical protein
MAHKLVFFLYDLGRFAQALLANRTRSRRAKFLGYLQMSFVLILHFVLNGHVHTVNTGRTFSSQQECSAGGEQAEGYVSLGSR